MTFRRDDQNAEKPTFYDRIQLIQSHLYATTGLTIYDVECGILNGKILERQRDKDTAEWKYKVNGQTISGDEIEVIAKLSPTGKLVIITVYEP